MYRINNLLKEKNQLFHTADLALLWDIKNKNTLYTTIKRYIQKGILIPIHKGFYSTVSLDQIHPYKLALGYLHHFTYISCETVLIKEGIIFQKENYITLISNIKRKFIVAGKNYLVRKAKDNFLYNRTGITEKDDYFIASPERAVADILYFYPKYHFDNRKAINWSQVKQIQKQLYL